MSVKRVDSCLLYFPQRMAISGTPHYIILQITLNICMRDLTIHLQSFCFLKIVRIS